MPSYTLGVASSPGSEPHPYGVGEAVITVECDDPTMHVLIEGALRDLRVESPEASAAVCRVHRSGPEWAPTPWRIDRDGQPATGQLRAADVVTGLLAEIIGLLVERSPTLVPLRAAAVVRHGQAALLLGRSEHESRALSLGLAARGWGLLGDVLVLVDPAGPLVVPFWCPVEGPRGDSAHAGAALVPLSRVASLEQARPLAAVVVPGPSAADERARLSAAETLAALVEHLAVVGRRAGAHVRSLADVVGSVPGWRAPLGEPDQADTSLAGLLGDR